MLKKIFGFLLITMMLWSCGSQFSRSKYDRHLWNRSHGKTDASAMLSDQKSNPEESNSNSGNVSEEKKATISMMDQEEIGAIAVKNTITSKDDAKITSVNSTKETTVENFSENKMDVTNNHPERIRKISLKKTPANPMQDGDVDAMWVVTLILCFIIPPLGVYLKDGAITGLFWVVLILCLVGGGILFGIPGYIGGFYGVGMILALLRFFDII